MIRLLLVLLLLIPSALAAEESSIQSYDDYVSIRFIPARGDFINADPVSELSARTNTHEVKATGEIVKTNEFIKSFYDELKRFKESGEHLPVYPDEKYTKLEVSYKGNVIALEYGGPSEEEKYKGAEAEWGRLYGAAYEFITGNVKP